MKNEKYRRILSAILSAACSASCAQVAGRESTGQTSSKITNKNTNKDARNASSDNKNEKHKDNIMKRVKSFTYNNYGLLPALLPLPAMGLLAQSVKNNYDSRSRKKKLENNASSITQMQNSINECNRYCEEKKEEIKEVDKKKMAYEVFAFSSDLCNISRTSVNEETFDSINNALKNNDKLLDNKKKKYDENQVKSLAHEEKISSLLNLLIVILTRLASDENFKKTIEDDIRKLKPSEGNGIIDLIKTSINAFEKAWCGASLDLTHCDENDYPKYEASAVETQKRRLSFFVNKFLDILLPIEKSEDGKIKEFKDQPKSTQKAAIFGCLFYKDDADDKLTIKQLIKNTLGNESTIVSTFAEHMQNIKEKVEIKYEYRDEAGNIQNKSVDKNIPSFEDFINLTSSSAYKRIEEYLDEKLPDAFKFVDVKCVSKTIELLVSGNKNISLSDIEIKNLLGSLVGQGVDDSTLLPKNFLNSSMGGLYMKYGGILASIKDGTIKNRTDLEKRLVDGDACNEQSVLGVFNAIFPKSKENKNSTILYDLEKKYKYEFERKHAEEAKALKAIESYWDEKEMDTAYWLKSYTENGYKIPENYYFSKDNLNTTFTENDLDNLKIVHEWNFVNSCLRDGEDNYVYKDINCDEYKNAEAAYNSIKDKCNGLSLYRVTENESYVEKYESGSCGCYNPKDPKRTMKKTLNDQWISSEVGKYVDFYNDKIIEDDDGKVLQLHAEISNDNLYLNKEKVLELIGDKQCTNDDLINICFWLSEVHKWNLYTSCYKGFWHHLDGYDANSEEYKNAKDYYDKLKEFLGAGLESNLKLAVPGKNLVWCGKNATGLDLFSAKETYFKR